MGILANEGLLGREPKHELKEAKNLHTAESWVIIISMIIMTRNILYIHVNTKYW